MPFVINRWGSSATQFEVIETGAVPMPETQQPGLPILRASFRSVDAKTLADNFNRGQPTEADYTWPGGRKFFQ